MVQFRALVIISSLSSNFSLPELRWYCASVHDLVMLLCSTQLTYRIHPGVSHGVTFNLIPNRMGFCHGQISIETATYSYKTPTLLSYSFHSHMEIHKSNLCITESHASMSQSNEYASVIWFIRWLRSSQSPLVVTQDAHHLLLVLLPLLLYRMFE